MQLLLLRHAQVDGHRGDVPITDHGREQARRAGDWISRSGFGDIATVLYGGTRRTRETAEEIIAGLGDEATLASPTDSFALRNPDLYLGGERVTMVSGADMFAAQVDWLSPDDVQQVPFFAEWLVHPERIGYWLRHTAPPGDDAVSVARRINCFARSLADVPQWRGRTVIAVTHSPVLRAVGLYLRGEDPGEPPYVGGYSFTVEGSELRINEIAPDTA